MRSVSDLVPHLPARVVSLHAQRFASRGLLNAVQARRMSRDADIRVRRISEVLRTSRVDPDVSALGAIERYRVQLASGSMATRYGVSEERMTALAMTASKSPRWAGLIFDLVVALRPTRVLEMGTAVGVSGSYIAAALGANHLGELITVDANRTNYNIACDTFMSLDVAKRVTAVHGTFERAVNDLSESLSSFDLVFKDGDHSEEATIRWFDMLAPELSPTSAFLLDDIRRDGGMNRAWNAIRRRRMVVASFDFFGMGLVLLSDQGGDRARHYHYGIG